MRRGALLLVSVDGLSAEALADATLNLPSLRGLAARGVSAAGLAPVFPSVTWPCHATLVTGVTPAKHGIVGNHAFDRTQGLVVSHVGDRTEQGIRGETLAERAAGAGLRTAAVCWPKTRGAACIADNIPEFYEQELFETHASRPLWDELGAAGLPVHRYGEWSREHALGPLQDWLSLETARFLLRQRPPDLMLLHFLVFDSFQHDHGVGSPEARWALEYVDGLLGTLFHELQAQGRLDTTDIVVLGDHGFVPVDRLALPNAVLHAEGLLRVDRNGEIADHDVRIVSNSGSAHVYVAHGPRRHALLERVRERFAAAPEVGAVIGPEEYASLGLPSPEDDPAQGDLMLTAAARWHFADHVSEEAAARVPAYRGTHGQLPTDGRLDAGFVAAGPSFVPGARAGRLSHLDIAPTAAAILGVDLPAAERAPLRDLLRG
jgi:predicted AlkP superfamily pyrophosphatase or phosphodiesterase